jgi:hypothetical protein
VVARSFVAAPVVACHSCHHLLRVAAVDIVEELDRSGLPERRGWATVVAYLDTVALHRELESTGSTRHSSEHAALIGAHVHE